MSVYDKLLPKRVLFNLRELQNLGVLKIDMAKKLISQQKLSFVKIGNKIHISRLEVCKFLDECTIEATSEVN